MVEASTIPFPLSIRPWPAKEDTSDSLPYLINRIVAQRGHLRNITEASLEKEIIALETGEERDAVKDEDEGARPQDVEFRRKELYAARAEMLKHIGQAQNEALTALDFISLLISKDLPRQAEMTMSPILKQLAPPGTLGFDKGRAAQPIKADEENDKLVALGWNLQSLDSAADKLLQSATKLETDMEREAKYWEQILSVSEQGWSVCSMQREGHTIGVRFGFSEAAPLFHVRGLAALRPSDDGSIILDQGLSKRPKAIKVQIWEKSQIIGTSSLPLMVGSAQSSLESLIRQARDSLFEEELFHELIRETQSLLSYGVKVVGHTIHVPLTPRNASSAVAMHKQADRLAIDLVPLDDDNTVVRTENQDSFNIAESVALAFRILLTNVYRRKFRVRSQPPPPVSEEKPPHPIQNILRPIMNHFQHNYSISYVQSFMGKLSQALDSAQLTSNFTTTRTSTYTHAQFHHSISTKHTRMETLVSTLSEPVTTSSVLVLPSTSVITVHTTTCLSAPTYGTLFHLTTSSCIPSSQPLHPVSTNFSNTKDLFEYIEYILRQDIASWITSLPLGWVMEATGLDLRKRWPNETKIKRLSVIVQRGRFRLLSGCLGEQLTQLGSWDGSSEGDQRSLRSVIEEISQMT